MKAIPNAEPILLEEVPALKSHLAELFDDYVYQYVGSLGKKPVSSDVDIIIDYPMNKFLDSCDPMIKANAKISAGFNLVSLPHIFNGKIIQLDLFFMEESDSWMWNRFMYSGSKERNQLLMAAVICKTKKFIQPGTWEQYNIRLNTGLWKVTKTNYSQRGQPIKNPRLLGQQFISNSPAYIYDMLEIPWEPSGSFEYLWENLKDNEEVVAKFNDYRSNVNKSLN